MDEHKAPLADPQDLLHKIAQGFAIQLFQHHGVTRADALAEAFAIVMLASGLDLKNCFTAEMDNMLHQTENETPQAHGKPVDGFLHHHCPNCLKTVQCALVRCPRPYETICADCETLGWYMDEGIVRYRGRN